MALNYSSFNSKEYSTDPIFSIKKGSDEYLVKDAVAAAAIDVINGNGEGSISKAKSDVIGNASNDTKDSKTIEGTRKYAKDYADGLASNYDATGAANTAESNAKNYADGLIAGLDASKSQTAGADGLALSITEVDGVITGISGSIAANTYDTHGAAATAKSDVIGESTDTSSADTIKGAKKYADEKAAAAQSAAIAKVNELAGTDWVASAGTVKDIIDELTAEGNTATANLTTVVDKLRGNFTVGTGASATTDVKSYIDNAKAEAIASANSSAKSTIANGVLTLGI